MLNKFKNWKDNIAFAKNSYNAGIVTLVLIIVIIANMMLQQVAGTSMQIDLSDSNVYEISETSETLVSELDCEISFTVIAVEEYIDEMVVNFIDKYTEMSDKISLEWIDPILYPSALETYNTTENTIVITNESTGKSTTVAITDILYQDEMSYYYYGETIIEFDGDGLFTSAIYQVTNAVEYKIYNVTGHSEQSFSAGIEDLMTKNNVVIEELNLLTATEIPEDCDLLTIYSPENDITADEKTLVSDYLATGGDAMILYSESAPSTPNLDELLLDYGLEKADGYIADLERAYQGNGYYLIPYLTISGDMAIDITSESVLVINTLGFTETTPIRDTISVSTFMKTSAQGLAVTADAEVTGEFILGAVASETITAEDGTTDDARLTVYGGANIINSTITDQFVSLDNVQLFMNSVMANFENSTNISIEAKVIEESYNVVSDPNLYSLLFIIIIPLTVIFAGLVVWLQRRKR
ncbi:MAG: Gldg family protein [Eubacteriales bacterium]